MGRYEPGYRCSTWATSSIPRHSAIAFGGGCVPGAAVPLLVTKRIGTADDEQRIAYVRHALQGVLEVIAEGIDVRGYTYWSLLDNFEWAFGYRPRFGLVSVDRTTFARTPKPSAAWLASIVAANALDQ